MQGHSGALVAVDPSFYGENSSCLGRLNAAGAAPILPTGSAFVYQTQGRVQKPVTRSPYDPHSRRHPEGTRSLCARRRVGVCFSGWHREPLALRTLRGGGVRVFAR